MIFTRKQMPSRVFVLCTGRCGSMTFIKACQHMTNYTAGHETRVKMLGAARLDYPERHIEADNRLSWVLGRLDKYYGKRAYYVHLARNRESTARSYNKRWIPPKAIMPAYRDGIHMAVKSNADPLEWCREYVDTVETNIDLFLRDKPRVMRVRLESMPGDFARFWRWIKAVGDLDAAMAEWSIRHNSSADR